MKRSRGPSVPEKLLQTATELFRRQGYTGTTVDQICEAAGVTKGAFFHHFKSKEAIAESCLAAWDQMAAAMETGAPFRSDPDPVRKLEGHMDFFIGMFQNPKLLRSCLAGTTVQEVADTHPKLRAAANQCFVNAGKRFQSLLEAAAGQRGKAINSRSLAALWLATIQGSILLSKASREKAVIPGNLQHVKQYILTLLDAT